MVTLGGTGPYFDVDWMGPLQIESHSCVSSSTCCCIKKMDNNAIQQFQPSTCTTVGAIRSCQDPKMKTIGAACNGQQAATPAGFNISGTAKDTGANATFWIMPAGGVQTVGTGTLQDDVSCKIIVRTASCGAYKMKQVSGKCTPNAITSIAGIPIAIVGGVVALIMAIAFVYFFWCCYCKKQAAVNPGEEGKPRNSKCDLFMDCCM